MGLRIAMIKIKKGVLGKITPNSKPYAFICPLDDVHVGNYVIVEVTRKTARKNVKNDFRVGKVLDILEWDEGTISQMRPNSFVVSKIACSDFEYRCNKVRENKYALWARYNALDSSQPNKNPEGVPMNLFDKLIDDKGVVRFERLNYYLYSKKRRRKKKKNNSNQEKKENTK